MLEVEAGAKTTLHFTLNGKPVQAEAEARMQLADLLRHVLKQYGTHVGCEHGLRGVHGADRRARGQIVSDIRCASRGRNRDHRRGACRGQWRAERFAIGIPQASRPAMRVLHARNPGICYPISERTRRRGRA